jgi:ribonuclease HI
MEATPRRGYKIQYCGAYVDGQQKGGWGVVARTSEGEVVAARAGCFGAIHDAFTTELRGMEAAFDLAAELGVIKVVFEIDSLLLATALNRRKPDVSRQASVIEDLKIQCCRWFSFLFNQV